MANNKKRPEQRIIITAGVTAKGDISMSVDFVPKMPTYQEFVKMPETKRGVIAVINQFSKYNKELIAQMMEHGPDFGKAAQGAADKMNTPATEKTAETDIETAKEVVDAIVEPAKAAG